MTSGSHSCYSLNMKTLLERFIESKVVGYREPTRVGVPRGEPVGFPVNKFHASLWCLTSLKGKEIADKVGISHGLLRKWRHEKEFKEKIKSNAEEFTKVFLMQTMHKAHLMAKDFGELKSSMERGIFAEKLKTFTFSEFDDLRFYDPLLAKKIAQELINVIKSIKVELFPYIRLVGYYICHRFQISGKIEIPWATSDKEGLRKDIDSVTRTLMEKSSLSHPERETIIALLTILRNIIR